MILKLQNNCVFGPGNLSCFQIHGSSIGKFTFQSNVGLSPNNFKNQTKDTGYESCYL